MNGVRRLLLAGTALTGDQDRYIHFSRFLNTPKQGLHRGAVANQAVLRLQIMLLTNRIFSQDGHSVGMAKRHDQSLRVDR